MRVILLALLAACGHLGVGQSTCSDASCQAVARHLDTLEQQRGNPCGTTRLRTYNALLDMGEQAVPALQAELDSRSVNRVRAAVDLLIGLGHSTEVAAWCRTLDQDDRGLTCAE